MFERDDVVLRQINHAGRADYEALMASGLYDELTGAGLLVPHVERDDAPAEPFQAWRVIRPERIGFISYPYEWCFSQLKSAALLTLGVQKRSLAHGVSLKDATAYNVQFHAGRPLFIDTLSFERLAGDRPWTAYRQFCQHFLAPLALMSRRDVRLSQLLRVHLDGIPLDLASRLLPFSTRLDPSLLTHIHLHARWQERHGDRAMPRGASASMSRSALLGLIEHLESTVRGLRWTPAGTVWGDYYDDTNYSPGAIRHKQEAVAAFIDRVRPGSVWDLGGNTGLFARLASARGIPTVCFDMDPAAVEKNWLASREARDAHMLPLLLDLANPTPGKGWMNRERQCLIDRGPADLTLGLALVHHLAISNQLPLEHIAELFAALSRHAIVEFVPRGDSQVQRLLSRRLDTFPDYEPAPFEAAFSAHFRIVERVKVHDSERTLYLLERRHE